LNNRNLKISISYLTNFKPSNFLTFKNYKLFKNKNSSRIISRNFFLFLLLLKYSNKTNFFNTTIFVKPFYKKLFTILRAPYRHKLSRHQFVLSRYSIVFTINFNLEKIMFKNITEILFFLKNIKKYYIWFESNIVQQHQTKIFLNIFFKNFFLLNFN
jgi:hypothetical protein